MIGYIIAAAVAALVLRNQQAQTAPSPTGTTVSVGVPSFGTTPPASSASREPQHTTFQAWQSGPYIPVPVGSNRDVLATNLAKSDTAVSQLINVGIFGSGGPTIINPPPVVGTGTAAAGGSSGGTSGGGSGGGTSTGGGGGLSGGGGGRFSLF